MCNNNAEDMYVYVGLIILAVREQALLVLL
jgi:hypothetical protein